MKKLILDTNAFRRLADGDVSLRMDVEQADWIGVTPIVLGEMLAGFKRGNRERNNLEKLGGFLNKDGVEILNIGYETAKVYAQIWNDLAKKGKPIPTNDMWIAAQAMENGAVLISSDEHFKEIAGLRVWEE